MKLFLYHGTLLLLLVAVHVSSLRGFPQKRQDDAAEYSDGTPFTLGTVITPLNESTRTTQAGFYLLPDVIPRAGTVLSLYACAFLTDTSPPTQYVFAVAPYRLVNGSYDQTASKDIVIIPYTSSDVTQDCISTTVLDLDWYVEQGDRLGVEIPNRCFNRPNGRQLCPAMPNFIGSECSTAHYNENFTTDMDNSIIPVAQLEDSNICINIRAVIAPAPPVIPKACHITSTFSPIETTLPTLEVTLGNLKQNLSGLEEFRGGGIYLLPERVPRDGSVVRVSACGFLNTLEFNRSEVDGFRFFLIGFREVENMFELVFTDQVIIFNGETQGCQNTSVSNETVMEGDRIGVYIEHECVQVNGRTACPAQINVVNRDDCSNQALYYYFPSRVSSISASRFTTLGIGVNIQVSVALSSIAQSPASTPLVQPTQPEEPQPPLDTKSIYTGTFVGFFGLLVLVLCPLFLILMLFNIRRKRSRPESLLHGNPASAVAVNYTAYKDSTRSAASENASYSHTQHNAEEHFRNRVTSEDNAYSVIGDDGTVVSLTSVESNRQPVISTDDYSTPFDHLRPPIKPPSPYENISVSEQTDSMPHITDRKETAPKHCQKDALPYQTPYSTSVPPFPILESGGDYEDYWMPASQEDELREQLLKLEVKDIARSAVGMGEYLGRGQFGTVYKGRWTSSSDGEEVREVAMKSLEAGAKEEDRIKFLQEAAIMGQFKHPNIVAILGIITMDEPYMIMTEMMHRGDLRQHLTAFSSEYSQRDQAELAAILLSYTRQIGCGMSYLAQKSFIHRDLAARNILVSEKEICKIADFGLSRDLQHSDYYVAHGGKIPVKWTAPEALCYRKYSTASDVWSYGVLLYEIWSLGYKPYTKFTNAEIIRKIMSGYRHTPPPGCPKAIYHLMIECWHPEAASRPTFPQLLLDLQQPDFQLLKWSPEDKAAYSEKAMTLGSPLEEGELLYTDLQLTYSQKETSEEGEDNNCF